MSLMLLAPISWSGRVWALPFLTALVSSERACREQGRRHKPLLDVGRQLALPVQARVPVCRFPAAVASHAIDPIAAERLWAMSERLLDT